MAIILSFVSIKGGVGKTTLALETAASLANDFDKKVLLVDANFSAPNLALYFDLNPEITLHHVFDGEGLQHAVHEAHGVDIIPASLDYNGDVDIFKLKQTLGRVKKRYDYIILDSSPNHKELMPVIAASDKVFVVTTPDNVTLRTSLKAANVAKENKTPVEGIIINKIRNPRYELALQEIEESGFIPVVARVKDHKHVAKALHHKKPVTIMDKKNPVSREVRKFSSALTGQTEEIDGFLKRFLFSKDIVNKEVVNRELLRQKFYESQFA